MPNVPHDNKSNIPSAQQVALRRRHEQALQEMEEEELQITEEVCKCQEKKVHKCTERMRQECEERERPEHEEKERLEHEERERQECEEGERLRREKEEQEDQGDLSGQVSSEWARVTPGNVWFAIIKVDIDHDRASKDGLQEALHLLNARVQADSHAMLVTSHFHPKFAEQQPIEHWDGHMQRILSREETIAFSNTLEKFLHDCKENHLNHHTYFRPRQYVIAAALDLDLSPVKLGELLQPLSQHSYQEN